MVSAALTSDEPVFPRLASSWVKRFVFLGTGTSGQVPAIGCLLPAPSASSSQSNNDGCRACHDAVVPGSKNRRGCCSLAIVGGGPRPQDESLILIDCGPTFYSSAISHFQRNGLRRIDAVLLTHAHADAILGLDNLRAWTMGGDIQSHVDIYCTQTCFETVEATFPYLVNGKKATGGGAVGELRFHIIDAHRPFQLPVHGGDGSGGRRAPIEVVPLPMFHGPHGGPNGAPFECLGFRVDTLSYLSDTHAVPASTSQRVAGSDVVIIDALNPYRHLSHFSLQQALSFVLSLPAPAATAKTATTASTLRQQLGSRRPGLPKLALLTDLTHNLEHHSTERELRRWNKEMHRRCRNLGQGATTASDGSSAASANGHAAETNGAAAASVGEGGGPRWWGAIWDEHESERLSGRRSLRLVDAFTKESGPLQQQQQQQQIQDLSLSDEDSGLQLPQFHVAWDGLAIEMGRPDT